MRAFLGSRNLMSGVQIAPYVLSLTRTTHAKLDRRQMFHDGLLSAATVQAAGRLTVLRPPVRGCSRFTRSQERLFGSDVNERTPREPKADSVRLWLGAITCAPQVESQISRISPSCITVRAL